MTKYQNYKHFKLPITMNPLEYGKLIIQKDELFIIQVNKTNIVLINQFDEFNQIKLYKEGDLMIEYKDHKVTNNQFVRAINNKKFTFKNNELTHIERTMKSSS